MKRLLNVIVVSCSMLLLAARGRADVIYVDGANMGAEDGETWATAWNTIPEGLSALADSNGVSQGGWTVLVAEVAGGYVQSATNTITAIHAGLSASHNVILSTNFATVDCAGTVSDGFFLEDTTCITIDGFNIANARNRGVIIDDSTKIVVRRCNIYPDVAYAHLPTMDYGIFVDGEALIENCTLTGADYAGLFFDSGTGPITCRNSIVVGNLVSGVYENGATRDVALRNCCFYANGVTHLYDEETTKRQTEAEINSAEGCSGNIVRNPGFAALFDDWDFSSFYEDSPCLTGGAGGTPMGAHASPSLVSVSDKTYYVAMSGGDGNSGLSWAQSWATVTNAAAHAVAGDTVMVSSGTYVGEVKPRGGSSNALVFRAVPGDTVVIKDDVETGFFCDRVSGVVIDGFECDGGANGYPQLEGAIRLFQSWDVTITNCVCYDSIYGVSCHKCTDVEVVDSELRDNTHGAFNYMPSVYNLRRCRIHNNSTYGWYGAYDYGSVNFYNCNIYSNGSHGIWTYTRGLGINSYLVENCTVYANGKSGIYPYHGRWTIRNTILAGNAEYGLGTTSTSNCPAYHCCFHNNTLGEHYYHAIPATNNTPAAIERTAGGSGNIVADPLFISPGADFRLQLGSPCVDAGMAPDDPGPDFYGNPRTAGPACDIGSYEMPLPGTLFMFL